MPGNDSTPGEETPTILEQLRARCPGEDIDQEVRSWFPEADVCRPLTPSETFLFHRLRAGVGDFASVLSKGLASRPESDAEISPAEKEALTFVAQQLDRIVFRGESATKFVQSMRGSVEKSARLNKMRAWANAVSDALDPELHSLRLAHLESQSLGREKFDMARKAWCISAEMLLARLSQIDSAAGALNVDILTNLLHRTHEGFASECTTEAKIREASRDRKELEKHGQYSPPPKAPQAGGLASEIANKCKAFSGDVPSSKEFKSLMLL